MEKNQIIHIAGECIIILGVIIYFNRQTTKLTSALINANERYTELESKFNQLDDKFNQLMGVMSNRSQGQVPPQPVQQTLPQQAPMTPQQQQQYQQYLQLRQQQQQQAQQQQQQQYQQQQLELQRQQQPLHPVSTMIKVPAETPQTPQTPQHVPQVYQPTSQQPRHPHQPQVQQSHPPQQPQPPQQQAQPPQQPQSPQQHPQQQAQSPQEDHYRSQVVVTKATVEEIAPEDLDKEIRAEIDGLNKVDVEERVAEQKESPPSIAMEFVDITATTRRRKPAGFSAV